MRRFGLRDITLYILLALMIFFTFTSLQQMDRRDAPTYSQIRTLFLQEQVEYFTLGARTGANLSASPIGWPTPTSFTTTCGSWSMSS